jgi:hypothetical protein
MSFWLKTHKFIVVGVSWFLVWPWWLGLVEREREAIAESFSLVVVGKKKKKKKNKRKDVTPFD